MKRDEEKIGKIKKMVYEHFDVMGGIDNLDLSTIFQELPAIFERLKEKGLIPPGVNLQHFMIIAEKACQQKWAEATFDSFRY